MKALLILSMLVVLHRADGGEVVVAPAHVISLHSAMPPGANKLMTHTARCVLWLADGRVLSVLEECAEVKRRLEVEPR